MMAGGGPLSRGMHQGLWAVVAVLVTSVAAAQPDAFTEMNTLMVGGEALDVTTMRNLVARGATQ